MMAVLVHLAEARPMGVWQHIALAFSRPGKPIDNILIGLQRHAAA